VAKSTKTKVKEAKKSLISVEVTFNGETKKIDTDNLLKVFREIDIDPILVKTPLELAISYNGIKINKSFHIVKFKKFLTSDLLKALVAKQFNIGLGIKVSNYL